MAIYRLEREGTHELGVRDFSDGCRLQVPFAERDFGRVSLGKRDLLAATWQ